MLSYLINENTFWDNEKTHNVSLYSNINTIKYLM